MPCSPLPPDRLAASNPTPSSLTSKRSRSSPSESVIVAREGEPDLLLSTWDLRPFSDDSDFLVAILAPQ